MLTLSLADNDSSNPVNLVSPDLLQASETILQALKLKSSHKATIDACAHGRLWQLAVQLPGTSHELPGL